MVSSSDAIGPEAVVGTLAGLLAGVLVGGLGSRIAMRIAAVAGGDQVRGLITDNENVVGEITLDGTIFLVLLGVFPGFIGGLLYMALRRVLPVPTYWKGLIYGLLLLATLGSVIIDSENSDFRRLPPAWLNILMFALLFPLFGLLLEPLVERFHRALPPVRSGRLGRRAYLFPPLALTYVLPFLGFLGANPVALTLAVALCLIYGGSLLALARLHDRWSPESDVRAGISSLVYPLLAGLFLVLVLPVVGFFEAENLKDRSLLSMFPLLLVSGVVLSAGRDVAAKVVGYVLLAAPALLGLVLDIGSVREILLP